MTDFLDTSGTLIGVIGGIVGLAGGAYGTFRSVATDRRTRALQRPWILEHHSDQIWLLRSNLPTQVTDVHLETADPKTLHILSQQGGVTMRPGDFMVVELHSQPNRMGNSLIVSCYDDRWWKRRRSPETVQVPPLPL